ncbi:MAG: FimB/Mfa2 family fimbrial subunit [Mangrovibacterium sp.]
MINKLCAFTLPLGGAGGDSAFTLSWRGLWLCLSLVASSCSLIAEKLEDCEVAPEKHYHFAFEFIESKEDGDNLPLQDVVDDIIIYLFDEQGNYVNQLAIENPIFGQEYDLDTVGVKMPAGVYQFVAWVNRSSSYEVNQIPQTKSTKANLPQLMLNVVLPAEGVLSEMLPELMHGAITQQVNLDGEDSIHIPIVRLSNMINLTVKGLESTVDEFVFRVSDNNGAYDFNANYLDFQDFSYEAKASMEEGELAFSQRILRIGEGREPRISLMNAANGNIIYPQSGDEDNLVELIKKAYAGRTIDFDAKHKFDIELNYNADLSVSITIDGWTINESGEVIGE